MKNFILSILFAFGIALSAIANVMPYRVSDVPDGVLGVYQPETNIMIYEKADKKSNIIFQRSWSYLSVSSAEFADNLFAILFDKKELSFLYATDIDEDFVQVVYDKSKQKSGWAVKEDNFQFLPWITFYNMYGRKYGLKILKGAPVEVLDIHSKTDKDSQLLGKLNRPKEIRLTSIQGNWALVTALDIEGVAKTGYIRWRGDDGKLYLFPAIK